MINLINLLFCRDRIDTTNRQDYTTMPDVNDKKIVEQASHQQSELDILVSELGKMHAGDTKEISLARMLTILPRNRKKADAYKSVRAALLKQYGVNLVITSKRTKGGNEYGSKIN